MRVRPLVVPVMLLARYEEPSVDPGTVTRVSRVAARYGQLVGIGWVSTGTSTGK